MSKLKRKSLKPALHSLEDSADEMDFEQAHGFEPWKPYICKRCGCQVSVRYFIVHRNRCS